MNMLQRFLTRAIGGEVRDDRDPGRARHLQCAIDSVLGAEIIQRAPDDIGPRIAIIAPLLGGSFYHSHDEAIERISARYPALTDAEVRQVFRQLDARVRAAVRPAPKVRQRKRFVDEWKFDQFDEEASK